MRNIYYYLEKINFEKRVTEEAKFIRDRKNSPDFDCLKSSFVFVQFVFGIVRDLFEEIYKDLEDK